jgi:hypothetical protein
MVVMISAVALAASSLLACATLAEPSFISVSLSYDKSVSDRQAQSRRGPLLEAAWAAACSIADRVCLGPESYAVRMIVRDNSCEIAIAVRIDDALRAQPQNTRKILSVAELSCEPDMKVTIDSYF